MYKKWPSIVGTMYELGGLSVFYLPISKLSRVEPREPCQLIFLD